MALKMTMDELGKVLQSTYAVRDTEPLKNVVKESKKLKAFAHNLKMMVDFIIDVAQGHDVTITLDQQDDDPDKPADQPAAAPPS